MSNAGVGSACAGDGASGGEDAHFLYFTGADLWCNGGFIHGVVLWSPDGLDHDGFVLKGMLGGGVYHYVSGALGNADVMGRQLSASVLPGWRFTHERLTVTVFAGLDLQNHRLTPDDPTAGLRGSYAGLRTGFDLWYEPSPGMVAADASASTVGPSHSGRIAIGGRFNDWFYLGPGMQGFTADADYRRFRAGAHITGFKFDTWEWSGGVGYIDDSDNRSGIYGKVGVLTRR